MAKRSARRQEILRRAGTQAARSAKKMRPTAMVTVGFTLISGGVWSIFGMGVGLITAGVLTIGLQWWVDTE
ncbi:hypothetical protein [Streptomyces tremellae]|uniref:Uncharacterized protein n=1 Tax=Streptomyces tremellae TaxID=1124239 RepID=A0ABP7EEU7_9ACTN